MSIVDAKERATGVLSPPLGETVCYKFDLPQGTMLNSLVEIKSQNTSNNSCGVYCMRVLMPTGELGEETCSVQPGKSAFSTGNVGAWNILLRTLRPCEGKGLIIRARWQ